MDYDNKLELLKSCVKLMEEQKTRILQLEGMLEDCLDYFEDRSDTIDGPDGPEPNRAMTMATAIKHTLEG